MAGTTLDPCSRRTTGKGPRSARGAWSRAWVSTRRWKFGCSFHSSAGASAVFLSMEGAGGDVPPIAGYHIVTSRSRLRRGSLKTIVLVPTGWQPLGRGRSNSAWFASEAREGKGSKTSTKKGRKQNDALVIIVDYS